jgi:glycosidase
MNLAAIYHRTSDNYCYAINNDELIINIKTGKDVKEVYLVYGDPFTGGILGSKSDWGGNKTSIPYKKELSHHIWWTTTITPEYKRCKYYFILVFTDKEKICFLEDGFFSEEEVHNLQIMKQMFTFPWLNPIDVHKTPSFVNETIWYQIFPDRFSKSKTHIDGITPWAEGPVRNEEVYGGDLQGVIDKLDYLDSLGINGIYLTPIFKAESIHKYDTTDYLEVDPLFGCNEDLKELVHKAHEKGMKIMLDGVFNHTSTNFFAWQDILKHGKKSKYFDWYLINDYPFSSHKHKTKDKEYYAFAFVDEMPKLNTNNPEVIEYLLKVVVYWITEFDIDGIRLDVANEVSHYFCKALRKTVKGMNKECFILGEIWHDSIRWLGNEEFDSVMNYPLTSAISNFWLKPMMHRQELKMKINQCYTMYMQQTNDVLFNLLDSHDTQRLINRVQFDIDTFYQQIMLLLSMPGSPCIYYGTEVALEGEHDPDCRRCMPWKDIEKGNYEKQMVLFKSMIALRKNNTALKSRNFHFEEEIDNERVIELLKIDDQGYQIKVIINASSRDITVNGKVIFSYKYNHNQLQQGGFIVLEI